MSKEQVLTIEKFRDGEESKYQIRSSKEIQLTLQAIAKNRSSVIMYYNHGERFLKTLLLGTTEKGIWLDVSPNEDENTALLNSEEITLVSMHQGAKVQLVCHHPIVAIYAANPAFYFPLPERIIRLQRRDYYRLMTTTDAPLKCVVTPLDNSVPNKHEITIMDISVGGVALVCKESSISLQEGETYQNCRIDLPGVGTLVANVEVKNLFDVTTPSGAVIKHAGCEFKQLNGQQSMLLQRYIALMQSKSTQTR